MAPAAAYMSSSSSTTIASFLSTSALLQPLSSSFPSSVSRLVYFLSSSSSAKTSNNNKLIISPPSLLRPHPHPRRRQQVIFTQPRAAAGTQNQELDKAEEERVRRVHSVEEFDEALRSAGKKLVVVEYANSKSHREDKIIYPFMVQLSRTCGDVEFLLVLGDESEDTKELCRREGIEKVPHFTFYKDMERVHDEQAGNVVGPDELMGDVLYYGNRHSEVLQLHSREDADSLMAAQHHKLIVLDVGLKHCGPCVKVYPTVIKLSRSMADTVVFARMNGDENDSCMQFLKDMEVIQVPTFLFIRDGRICGRYVGSGKGELIGEILRYQGVRVTY